MKLFRRSATAVMFLALAALPLCGQTNPMLPAIPAKFTPPRTHYDYAKRMVMILTRDGVVPNIFDARPADYKKAIERVWHSPGDASFIDMPVVP